MHTRSRKISRASRSARSLGAPARTPRPILNQSSKEIGRILELPDIKVRLQNYDYVAAPSTPEEHNRILHADIETFAGVVRLAGLRPK